MPPGAVPDLHSPDYDSAERPIVHPGHAQAPSTDPASGPQTSPYFAFTPQFRGGPLRMEVRMLDKGQPGAPTVGNWQFVLIPE